MLSQKCHYYFLIIAVQLLTYIVSYFPVHQLLISCDFSTFPQSCDCGKITWPCKSANIWHFLSTLTITPTWPKMVVSQMPHNWDISNWQRTWCKSVECARIYPPLISVVGVVPPPIHLLCWESFVFLLFITVKVRASFTSSTWFLICLVVLWLQCLLLPLWPTQCCICHIASLHQCLPSVLADMPLLLHPPCHLTTIPHATSPPHWPWIYGMWPVGCNGEAFIV